MSDQSQSDSAEPTDLTETANPKAGKASRKSGQRYMLTTALIALVAGAVGGMAVAGWWHPPSSAPAKYSDQQVADAKKDLCDAALLARQAVAKNMHLKNPDPENPVAQYAVAANARQSLSGGAAYLRGRLAEDGAAPQDLVEAARAMAGALEHLNLSYLVGQSNSDHEQLGRDLDSGITELGKLCQ